MRGEDEKEDGWEDMFIDEEDWAAGLGWKSWLRRSSQQDSNSQSRRRWAGNDINA